MTSLAAELKLWPAISRFFAQRRRAAAPPDPLRARLEARRSLRYLPEHLLRDIGL